MVNLRVKFRVRFRVGFGVRIRQPVGPKPAVGSQVSGSWDPTVGPIYTAKK